MLGNKLKVMQEREKIWQHFSYLTRFESENSNTINITEQLKQNSKEILPWNCQSVI